MNGKLEFELPVRPLTAAEFAPFGEVIETGGAEHFTINQGTTERYHDLAKVDVGEGGGVPLISIFRSRPRPVPIIIELMERHPLGSQAFVPLSPRPFLAVVARHGEAIAAGDLRAFITNGRQGVSYNRNVWHHPVLALGEISDFLVIDRGGSGENLQEFNLRDSIIRINV